MIFSKAKNQSAGFSIIEIIISLGIFSIIIFAVSRLFFVSREAASVGRDRVKAGSLAAEYFQGLKNLRKDNWNSLVNGRYLLSSQTGNLILESTTDGQLVDKFVRYLEISDTYRDEEGDLVESGGTIDPSTKKITVVVSWSGWHDSSLIKTGYLTRYLDNLSWTETTVEHFNAGEMELVEIVDPIIDDGEIQLKGGCEDNPSGAWIFDEEFQNSWQVHPSAKSDIVVVDSTIGEVYEGEKSLEISSFNGTSTKLRNVISICTLGFTNIEFYAYNDADIPQSFKLGGNWEQEFVGVSLPSRSWEHISLSYGDVFGGDEVNFNFIFFRSGDEYQIGTKFYLDNFTLGNGVGGFYQMGTLTSSVFEADYSSSLNRISFDGLMPVNTQIGFQTAVSDNLDGPWLFYGPGGTGLDDDLYLNSNGEGIWLGANIGQYFRYKAFLKTSDGQETPILYQVIVNYSP